MLSNRVGIPLCSACALAQDLLAVILSASSWISRSGRFETHTLIGFVGLSGAEAGDESVSVANTYQQIGDGHV